MSVFISPTTLAVNTASANADPNFHPAYALSYLDGGAVTSKTYTLVGPSQRQLRREVNADTASTAERPQPAVITNRLAFDTTGITPTATNQFEGR